MRNTRLFFYLVAGLSFVGTIFLGPATSYSAGDGSKADDDVQARLDAVAAIATVEKYPYDASKIIPFFKDPNAKVRTFALGAMGGAKIDSTADYLAVVRGSEEDPSFQARAAALNSMRAITPRTLGPTVLPGVIEGCHSKDAETRALSVLAVGYMCNAAGTTLESQYPILKAAMADPEPRVQIAAIDAISANSGMTTYEEHDLISDALANESADESVRCEAALTMYCNAIDNAREPHFQAAVKSASSSKNTEVRRAAFVVWREAAYRVKTHGLPGFGDATDAQITDGLHSHLHWIRIFSWGQLGGPSLERRTVNGSETNYQSLLAAMNDTDTGVVADASLELAGVVDTTLRWTLPGSHMNRPAPVEVPSPFVAKSAPAEVIMCNDKDAGTRVKGIAQMTSELAESKYGVALLVRMLADSDKGVQAAAVKKLRFGVVHPDAR